MDYTEKERRDITNVTFYKINLEDKSEVFMKGDIIDDYGDVKNIKTSYLKYINIEGKEIHSQRTIYNII